MNYDENVFKEKANIKARRIWLVFALLLTANYGSDAANGLYPLYPAQQLHQLHLPMCFLSQAFWFFTRTAAL